MADAVDLSEPERLECGCRPWEHELFDGYCPPPPYPRECCGTTDWGNDVTRRCSNGCCLEWFCRCGVHTGSGMGPVGCGCDFGSWGHGTVGERPMLSTPNGREYTRRRKARNKR